jgi:pentatricopeptide repeat protein
VGYPPDLYTHTARISALGKGRQSSAVLVQLHEAMRDPVCAGMIELYNAAISACVRSQDFAGAMYVWGLVLGDGETRGAAKPDVVTFNAMIKVAGAMGRFDDATRYFDMITEHGLVPTSWTYAALFSASAACQQGEVQFLIGVFDSMVVQPNDYILSSFFTAMSFLPCSKADIDVVFRLLERSRGQTSDINDVTYTAFMVFLARQDVPDRAIDIWVAARNDEIDLSPHFFSALFSACAKGVVVRSAVARRMCRIAACRARRRRWLTLRLMRLMTFLAGGSTRTPNGCRSTFATTFAWRTTRFCTSWAWLVRTTSRS